MVSTYISLQPATGLILFSRKSGKCDYCGHCHQHLKILRIRKWEQRLHCQLPVSDSLTKKANMTHQKENPPIGHKHHFWTICQSILFKELANWPTTRVLLVIWNPGMSPHYTSSSSGWSFLCNSGRAREQQGFMGIPNPMQFTCYVAIKVIILVTYCCITGYLKT